MLAYFTRDYSSIFDVPHTCNHLWMMATVLFLLRYRLQYLRLPANFDRGNVPPQLWPLRPIRVLDHRNRHLNPSIRRKIVSACSSTRQDIAEMDGNPDEYKCQEYWVSIVQSAWICQIIYYIKYCEIGQTFAVFSSEIGYEYGTKGSLWYTREFT